MDCSGSEMECSETLLIRLAGEQSIGRVDSVRFTAMKDGERVLVGVREKGGR